MSGRAVSSIDRIGRYLERRADLAGRPLVSGPLDDVKQVVVIPMLEERDSIEANLGSLAENAADHLQETLIICVVNNRAEPHIDEDARHDNEKSLAFLGDLTHGKAEGTLARLRVGYIDAASEGRELGAKEGVGTARKLGLDWGLEVLRRAGTSDGVLICLDADTLVEPDYLAAIRGHFESRDGGAVIDFAHRLDGPAEQQKAIIAYELYQRYHVLGLGYAGSPYAFHAIGSTIASTADAYVAAGGMNRRQAGEDFYFLQALAKTSRVDRIRTTKVHPSSRPSRRAPFGTGQRVDRFLQGKDREYLVYHPDSYKILRAWFELVGTHRDAEAISLLELAKEIDVQLVVFLLTQEFEAVWPKLQANARDADALLLQFHRWFDGFMSLKLIHYLRDKGLSEVDTFKALARLGKWRGYPLIEPDSLRSNLAQQKSLLEKLRGL